MPTLLFGVGSIIGAVAIGVVVWPSQPWAAGVLALSLAAIGVMAGFSRRVALIDPEQRRYQVRSTPVGRFFADWQTMPTVESIRVWHEQRGGGSARVEDRYPIALTGPEPSIELLAPRKPEKARDQARQLAQALGVELRDHIQ